MAAERQDRLATVSCRASHRTDRSLSSPSADVLPRLQQLQLLHQVFTASSQQLDQLGRGDLLALLMADITRSGLSLEQAVRMVQTLLSMLIYLASVLLVGRAATWPLLLALMASAAAALIQRSGSWGLGRIQSRLNAAMQRTVGDGLHGLKALRAAAAESWLLRRFAEETSKGRWLLRERVRRRAGYNAWRDTLVVAIAASWPLLQGEALTAEALTTTLLLAYRAGTSLSGVVQARRVCLGNLPGYEALCERRGRLHRTAWQPHDVSLPPPALRMLEPPALAGKSAQRINCDEHRPAVQPAAGHHGTFRLRQNKAAGTDQWTAEGRDQPLGN